MNELKNKKLENKVALVTGASSGIGKAAALILAKEGAKVTVNGFKNLKGINNTVKKIEESGGTAIGFKADVSNIVEVKIMVEEIIKKFGIIDILVNNSGISQEGIESIDNVINLEEKDWDKVVNINLKGIFLTSKFVLPHMVRQKSGTIINISSILGALAGPNLAAYCASKGGMLTLTKEMAWDYGKYNIRVNCISPGYVETDIFNFTLGVNLW